MTNAQANAVSATIQRLRPGTPVEVLPYKDSYTNEPLNDFYCSIPGYHFPFGDNPETLDYASELADALAAIDDAAIAWDTIKVIIEDNKKAKEVAP